MSDESAEIYCGEANDLRAELSDLRAKLEAAQAMQKRLVDTLGQILADLPMRRDWLDPHLEKRAKELLSEIPS